MLSPLFALGNWPILALLGAVVALVVTLAVHRHIFSGQVRAALVLSEEHAKLALIAQKTDNAVVLTDKRGRVEWVNDGFRRQTGYDLDEVLGRKPGEFLQGAETETATVAIMTSALQVQQDFIVEVLNYTKAAVPYWTRLSVQHVRNDAGEVKGIFSMNVDITERKNSELAVRRSAQQFENLFEFSPDALVMIHVSGVIKMINRAAERLFGYERGALVGQFGTLLLAAGASSSVWSRKFSGADGLIAEVSTEGRRKDGTAFPMAVTLSPLDVAGEPWTAAAIRDMTAREEAERIALRTNRLEGIADLASGVAHDLNNALAPILMGIELLRKQQKGPSKLIDIMESSAQRGAGMVRQLVTLAYPDKSSRASVKSRMLFQEMTKIIEGTFPSNLHARMTCAENLRPVLGDVTQLHQVLLNLCVNARDAMPEGGTLTLMAESALVTVEDPLAHPGLTPGEYVVWQISDTGTGIPPEIIGRIFESRFTTKDPDHGTGLGLATVKQIVQSHGGIIGVKSTPNVGTTFTVYLPMQADTASTTKHPFADRSAFSGTGKLVVIVESEDAVREMMRVVLTALDFRVITAADGAEVRARLATLTAEVHALIVNFHVGATGGLALVQDLRRLRPGARMIISTGRLDDDETRGLETLGLHIRLDKPFTQLTLVETLRPLCS